MQQNDSPADGYCDPLCRAPLAVGLGCWPRTPPPGSRRRDCHFDGTTLFAPIENT